MVKNDVLDNKGYMLIEMILASVIAFTIAYFAIDMTIKIKNKNDDLLVETLVATDQAINMNGYMSMLFNSYIAQKRFNGFSYRWAECSPSEIVKSGFEKRMSKYVDIEYDSKTDCAIDNDKYVDNVHFIVKQLPEKNFDIIIKFRHPTIPDDTF